MKFILETTKERIVGTSGLAIIGALLDKTAIRKRFSKLTIPAIRSTPHISSGDIITSYFGLLVQSKNDFEWIEEAREDPFFAYSLDLRSVPSAATLRQRLDQIAATNAYKSILMEESARLLREVDAPISPISLQGTADQQLVALDIDVSPFDNSNTKKEGVSRTYKGCDGYAPIFAYIGQQGYVVNTELREGKTHSQNGTVDFLRETIRYAKQLTPHELLVRMDGGNDAKENLTTCLEMEVGFLIKRNLRKEKPEDWLIEARKNGEEYPAREGKQVFFGSVDVHISGFEKPIRQVYKVTERTIDKYGQIHLIPEVTCESYWTTLDLPPVDVISIYHDHGTSEQFHSEWKTDLDLERLPSGKFATNNLILHLGCVAYNLLRMIGQAMLEEPDEPLRTNVSRRRIKTVIKSIITLASKMVMHARQMRLKFSQFQKWYTTFQRLYYSFHMV